MCNFEILLWFIRKKQHKIKEIWSFSVLLPTPVWQLPLPLTELIKSEPCTFVCTHKIMKTTGKSGLASGSCFECFVCIYFGKFGSNINLRQNKTKKKIKTNCRLRRKAASVPFERGHLRCLTFSGASHNPTVALQLLWSQLELLMTQ